MPDFLERRSPVDLISRLSQTQPRRERATRHDADASDGLRIIDLSRFARWDIQDHNLQQVKPYGDLIPAAPAGIYLNAGLLLGRLNATQAIAWHLTTDLPVLPEDGAFTDVTEAAAAMALTGPALFDLVEKLCALDLANPGLALPRVVQGPFAHVPCHLWVLARTGTAGCIALTCSRGYARDMVDAIFNAGAQWGISPEGEDVFIRSYQ